MSESENGDAGSERLIRLLEWVTAIDPAAAKDEGERRRRAFAGEDPRRIAERIVASYSRKGAFEGFVTGLPGNPLLMVPGAMADIGYVMRLYAHMTAVIGYLANDKYFENPDWRDDALLMLAGPKAVSRVMREAGIQFGKQASKHLIRKHLSKAVLKALKRAILKWLGKKVTQRAIIAKMVPVVGGVIGAGWNYAELRIVGQRIIGYHFDGSLD